MPPPGTFGTAGACKRRSSRIKLKIPITIHAGDVVLKAETVSVSKHGAKIRIMSVSEKLSCGEQMRVAVRAGQQAQSARVVWLDKTRDPHCGIELEAPDNFWGVYFPHKTDDDLRTERRTAPPAKHLAPAPKPAAGPERTTPPAELRITAQARQTVVHDEATDTRIMSAMVTGLSAVSLPLSESVDIVFTRPDEATALLRDLVAPGTTVRLLLSKDRVVMGRVAAIGTQRHAGKWRVRIKCDAPCY